MSVSCPEQIAQGTGGRVPALPVRGLLARRMAEAAVAAAVRASAGAVLARRSAR